MHFKLLSEKDMKAMDALIDSYGGAKEITQKIDEIREYEKRKEAAGNKGFGETIEKHQYECFPNEPLSFHAIKTDKVTTRAFWDSGTPVGFSLSKPDQDSIKSAFLNIYSTHLPDKKKNYRLSLF